MQFTSNINRCKFIIFKWNIINIIITTITICINIANDKITSNNTFNELILKNENWECSVIITRILLVRDSYYRWFYLCMKLLWWMSLIIMIRGHESKRASRILRYI